MKMSGLLTRNASRPGLTGTARVDRNIDRLLRQLLPFIRTIAAAKIWIVSLMSRRLSVTSLEPLTVPLLHDFYLSQAKPACPPG